MELTKEWLHNNNWVVCVENEQEGAAVSERLQGKYGIPVTPYEGEQIYREGTTGIAHATVFPCMWFTSLEEDTFENKITSLVMAEMQAEKEKQMPEQKYVPVPEGGWTEDNIPLEFEYERVQHKTISGFGLFEDGWHYKATTGEYYGIDVSVDYVLREMNECNGTERRITKIIKPSKEQQMKEASQSVDNNSPLPFLKPFVRLVTRGKGTYIYQGIREQHTRYPGMHHAVSSDSSFDTWDDTLSDNEYEEYDVVSIYDYPEVTAHLLDIDKKGKLLWQREDSKLKELQQAVEEATKALEDYKREKGVA